MIWMMRDVWKVDHTTEKNFGSIKICGKLPTYPYPKPKLSLTSHLGQNVALGEGWVGSFPEI